MAEALGPSDAHRTALELGQAAALLGAYCFIERRLFELTGAWSVEVEPPRLQVHLDQVSQQHAWHAALWAERLPVLAGVEPASLIAPLGPSLGPVLDALASAPSAPERLAGLYRCVLPRLLSTYGRHLRRAVPATDAPVVRALRLVRTDELAAWQAGEALLQSLIDTAETAAVAAAAAARLEAQLLTGHAAVGLVPWPGQRT
ncbi:MAG TPA: hypothetical protein VN781_03500 [Acidimicrobiales bacterium]|nr:hypothetical protein [Acidimicrobiales bacterium]